MEVFFCWFGSIFLLVWKYFSVGLEVFFCWFGSAMIALDFVDRSKTGKIEQKKVK
jgi:hypothetical protein